MNRWRSVASLVCYALAIFITLAGTVFVIWAHHEFWLAGKIIIGTFSPLLMVEYILASAVLWGIGHVLQKRREFNILLLVLTLIPIAMIIFIPVKFAA